MPSDERLENFILLGFKISDAWVRLEMIAWSFFIKEKSKNSSASQFIHRIFVHKTLSLPLLRFASLLYEWIHEKKMVTISYKHATYFASQCAKIKGWNFHRNMQFLILSIVIKVAILKSGGNTYENFSGISHESWLN